MKNQFSGLLARAAAAALALLGASAALAATVTVTPSTAAPTVGSTFYIDVSGTGFPDTVGADLAVIYDPTKVQVTVTSSGAGPSYTVNSGIELTATSPFQGGIVSTEVAPPSGTYPSGGVFSLLAPTTGALPSGSFSAFRVTFLALAVGDAGISIADAPGGGWTEDVVFTPVAVTYNQATVTVAAAGGGGGAVTTTVSGKMGITAQGCLQGLTNAVGDGENCMYSGGPTQRALTQPAGEGTGPYGQGSYYSSVTTPQAFATGFVPVPNDGKIQQNLNGTVTVDDNGTPGDASDDLLSFDITFTDPNGGDIIRWLSSSVVDKYTSMNQVLAPHAVDSATANAAGGYDYVIASKGFPVRLSFTDATANESAVGANDGPCVGQLFGEMDCDASFTPILLDPLRWDPWSYNPPGPSASPGLGSLEDNLGTRTVGTVTNLACVGTNGSSGGNDCFDSKVSFAPIVIGPNQAPDNGKMAEDVGWDQLVVKVSTNAAGEVTSIQGYDVQEYNVFGPAFVCGSDPHNAGDPDYVAQCNSWISGFFSATNGSAQAVDDTASTTTGVAVNVLVAQNDSGFSNPVTITIGTAPSHGGAVVNGSPGTTSAVSVTYTPTAGYTGNDTFTYNITDGVNNGTAQVSVTISAAGNITPVATAGAISITTQGVAPGTQSGNFTAPGGGGGASLGNLPSVITVTSAPTHGTTSVNGTIVTYNLTDTAFFAGTDTFQYTITDADSETSTATVTVSVPNLTPSIADATLTTQQDVATTAFTPTITLGNGSATQHTLAVTAQANNGSCAVTPGNATGTLVYTPNAGYTGSDTCTLTITDGNGSTDTATINVTVGSEAPVINLGGGSAVDPMSLVLLGGLPLLARRRNRR